MLIICYTQSVQCIPFALSMGNNSVVASGRNGVVENGNQEKWIERRMRRFTGARNVSNGELLILREGELLQCPILAPPETRIRHRFVVLDHQVARIRTIWCCRSCLCRFQYLRQRPCGIHFSLLVFGRYVPAQYFYRMRDILLARIPQRSFLDW